jgi:outer membrane receptor protein involved in Fe transport
MITRWLFVALVACGVAAPVFAQEQTTAVPKLATASSKSDALEEVVVTGSRIHQSGYTQPTPVTMVTAEQLQQSNPGGVSQALNQLPQFVGSISPNQTPTPTLGQQVGNYLNLRDVGINRTLILVDGTRVPPTTATGQVDVDVIPEMLVSRVDVVTGGVSAVYGSDAVTGVVNYILDKKFTGVKTLVQGGISNDGDGSSYKVGVALGQGLFDDRGHVLFSAEATKTNPVSRADRPLTAQNWFEMPTYVPGATEPDGSIAGPTGSVNNPLRPASGVVSAFTTPSGSFLAGPPGVIGMSLTPTGGLAPFNHGSLSVPGYEGQIGGDGFPWPSDRTLIASTNSQRGYLRLSYDITPDINVFAEGNVSNTRATFGDAFNVIQALIFPNNAYLPAAAQAAFAADPNPADQAAYLLKIPDDLGLPVQEQLVRSYGAKTGIKVALGDWRLEGDYIYGHVHYNARESNEINQQHLYAAIASINTPGGPACLATLLDPAQYSDCVPYNPFITNGNSQAVKNYLLGASIYDVFNETNDVTFNLSGHAFSTWAGPIGVAVGAEYRTASLLETTNSSPGLPYSTSGLIDPTINPSQIYNITNTGSAKGSVNVKEGNLELLVPLARNLPFARELSATGAVRFTDYSTSGSVKTWKLGGTWEPISDVRFRFSRSRDIRAPTLFDLFAGETATRGPVFDAQANTCGTQGCTQSNGIFINGGGNPNLKPEVSYTTIVGIILQPRFIPHFTASVDYYDLTIEAAITQLTPSQIIEDCYVSNGTAAACQNVTRPGGPASNQPATQVFDGGINAAVWHTKGVDFESTYDLRLAEISSGIPGDLSFRALANHVRSFIVQNDPGSPAQEQAGYTDSVLQTGQGQLSTPVPHWRGNLSATYAVGPATVFLQERVVGSIRQGGPEFNYIYAQPTLPAVYYTDLTANYEIPVGTGKAQVFLTVNNLFNKQPPLFPNNQVPGLVYPTIQSLYDVMGRYFTLGVRASF